MRNIHIITVLMMLLVISGWSIQGAAGGPGTYLACIAWCGAWAWWLGPVGYATCVAGCSIYLVAPTP